MSPAAPPERRLAYAAVALGYLQIVFGAIVRITGSGMGCGDHWPKCLGRFFPPLDRPDLIIELTHRYLAVSLTLMVLAIVAVAFMRRRPGGPDLRRPSLVALAIVIGAALVGAVTVKLALAVTAVVLHLALAVTLLAILAWMVVSAGGFGAVAMREREPEVAPRTRRAATAAAALALTIVFFGALTANVAGAAGSCAGFPHCREVFAGGAPLWIHLTHRILAFALLFHAIGLAIGVRRRAEGMPVRRGAALLVTVLVLQVLAAAAMVEMQFPPVLRSIHQALGTLVWLVAFTLAALTWLRSASPVRPA